MEIIDRGIAIKGEKGTDYQSCLFPGFCVLPSGRWLVSCRAAPARNNNWNQRVFLSYSDDEGKSWSEPFAPFQPAEVKGKIGVFRGAYLTSLGGSEVFAALHWIDYTDPDLPVFNEKTEGVLDCLIFVSRSFDNGMSWSKPELIDTSPYFNWPVPITGPALYIEPDCLALQFELNKPYYETSPWHHASVLLFSHDRGKTWKQPIIVAKDPENKIFYWDQRPGVLSDGSILDVFWTYNNENCSYLNIHARYSPDKGKTWSEIWDTGVPGQPGHPVSLRDGKIAMPFIQRDGFPVIKMRISSDNGRTWQENTEIIVYNSADKFSHSERKSMKDTWSEFNKFTTGWPITAKTKNSDIIVAYYNGPHPDHTNIEWVRIRP
ncbi:MAG: glycoside hydrolase [Candidatus Omnitrophica bacterium]|nr:glycoside hydrolase [Candidatus Omnitrophota bacterium]